MSARPKELEQADVVHRRVMPGPDGAIVYELTEYGRKIEEAVLALGRWDAQSLDQPGPDDIVTADSMIMAMRTAFRPEAARGLTVGYELRMGDVVLNIRIKDCELDVGPGPLPDADLGIEAGPAIKALMAGDLTPAEAITNGCVRITGDATLLERFTQVFQL